MGKEEIKLSLCADDMVLYLKDPKDYTRKVINTLGKVAGDKINIQKSIDFLYTST
jgi:hypothetical protein